MNKSNIDKGWAKLLRIVVAQYKNKTENVTRDMLASLTGRDLADFMNATPREQYTYRLEIASKRTEFADYEYEFNENVIRMTNQQLIFKGW